MNNVLEDYINAMTEEKKQELQIMEKTFYYYLYTVNECFVTWKTDGIFYLFKKLYFLVLATKKT